MRQCQCGYLAAGDGEVGEDAVFLVLVARVRLQALALTVVPELERAARGMHARVNACTSH